MNRGIYPDNDFVNYTEPSQWREPNIFLTGKDGLDSAIGASTSYPQTTSSSFASNTIIHEASVVPTSRPFDSTRPRAPPARHRGLYWEEHQAELKELYLVQMKTLEEVRQYMSSERSFDATSKQYKDRFRLWGWQKNLPVETARFMVAKSNERKRGAMRKRTTFEFGGMSWTTERALETIKRARKQVQEAQDMSTPNGVIYQTPGDNNASPAETALTPYRVDENVDEIVSIASGSSSDEWEPDSDGDMETLPLLWNGQTRSDVHKLFLGAQSTARNGDPVAAEAMLKSSVAGYKHLLGPIHEETNRVIFSIATFYFERDRLTDAYQVIEDSCRAHIQIAGAYDRRTQQHVNNIAELLNGWNREEDALALLARAKEWVSTCRHKNHVRQQRLTTERRQESSSNSVIEEATQMITGNPSDTAQLDYGLSVARTQCSTRFESAKQLLVSIIEQCGQDTEKLAVQRLKAWAELLALHHKEGKGNASVETFKNAHAAFMDVLHRYPMDATTRRKFKCFEVIEASLELVAQFVKGIYLEDAKRMFQKCIDRAMTIFGDEDERTIWMLISIGLVYQRYTTWVDAQPWFEQALAAAMDKYDENDGIRISLEEALIESHFSYINDEGRPFKTIFGVNGLRIMPSRLHIA